MGIPNNTTKLQSLIDKINALPEAGGIELPALTNEGAAADLLSGKQLIDGDGNIVTGTIQTQTASNLSASGAIVTVPAGYYASQVTKSVSTATQATPSITVNSAGKITASATQSAGYVSAGTKSATKQLTTQVAKTITPTESSQTAVAKNVYTTGVVTVGAIPDGYMVGNEISEQDSLIAQIASALESKASGGNTEPILQDKTVTPTTSKQTITADSNYDGLGTVTVNAMPIATQATPNITVNSSGLITASSTQSAGYVSSGTKSATKQLTIETWILTMKDGSTINKDMVVL